LILNHRWSFDPANQKQKKQHTYEYLSSIITPPTTLYKSSSLARFHGILGDEASNGPFTACKKGRCSIINESAKKNKKKGSFFEKLPEPIISVEAFFLRIHRVPIDDDDRRRQNDCFENAFENAIEQYAAAENLFAARK
jgi:hypothetical protein